MSKKEEDFLKIPVFGYALLLDWAGISVSAGFNAGPGEIDLFVEQAFTARHTGSISGFMILEILMTWGKCGVLLEVIGVGKLKGHDVGELVAV